MTVHKLYGINNEIEYDTNICLCGHHVPTLKHLSAVTLISNSYILSKVIRSGIPQKLLTFLGTVALLHGCTPSIKLLLNNWPLEHFTIPSSDVFKSWKFFCLKSYSAEFRDAMKKFYESAATVVRHVVGWVSESIRKPIRVVDIGDCFIPDILVNILASTALMSNEREFAYMREVEGENVGVRLHHADEMNNRGYIIRVNCILETKQCVYLLLKLLEFSHNFEGGHLKLVITGLYVKPDAFGKKIFELIRLLNPDELKVFNIENCYNWRNEDRFRCIAKFHYLQGLDISYLGMNAIQQPEMLSRVGYLLCSLPHLKRFDISRSRLTNKLADVMLGFPSRESCAYCYNRGKTVEYSELRYLSLADCHLSEADVTYLAFSYAPSLLYLNLSYTYFTSDSIVQLLSACKKVQVLYMESCRFSEDAAPFLFEALLGMNNLRYLNIANVNIMRTLVPYIGCDGQNLPQVRTLHIFGPAWEDQLGPRPMTQLLTTKCVNPCASLSESHQCQCKLIW